jgi:hypothetical protein
VHFELQAGYLATLDRRTLLQNVAITEKFDLPVSSVLVLLHPHANSPRFTGRLQLPDADGNVYLQFGYRVMRVWELDAEALLSGGTGTLPLTPLSQVVESELPGVIRRMEQRIAAETTAVESAELWLATYVLMGLRFSPSVAGELLKGVGAMKESATYQAILQEGEQRGRVLGEQQGRAIGEQEGRAIGEQQGRAEEARTVLIRLGSKRFGSPTAEVRSAIEAESDLARLEALLDSLLEAESWDELLAR